MNFKNKPETVVISMKGKDVTLVHVSKIEAKKFFINNGYFFVSSHVKPDDVFGLQVSSKYDRNSKKFGVLVYDFEVTKCNCDTCVCWIPM